MLKNDFIELFNPGGVAVSVAGWSVQYASQTGTSWRVTNLSGTIQQGAYYLVQEQAGANVNATPLPTPDAIDRRARLPAGHPDGNFSASRNSVEDP